MEDPTNITNWLDLAKEHGPWAIFSIVGGFVCYKLVMFILKHLLKQIEIERNSREKSDAAHLKALEKHTEIIDQLSLSNKEAHQFQRNEHGTMIIAMGQITEQQEKLRESVIDSINKPQA